jgi:hypothetical protein
MKRASRKKFRRLVMDSLLWLALPFAIPFYAAQVVASELERRRSLA